MKAAPHFEQFFCIPKYNHRLRRWITDYADRITDFADRITDYTDNKDFTDETYFNGDVFPSPIGEGLGMRLIMDYTDKIDFQG